MKKWNMIIDVARCHDCNNCFLACKDEFVDNSWLPYSEAQPWHGQRWMNIMRKERGQYPNIGVSYLPIPCMHCDDARCVEKEQDGAVVKREDGIVLIDPEKSKGQKDIVDRCPYGAIWWNEEKKIAQKCSFCVHLLEKGWTQPRCVQACPTGAMRVVKTEDKEIAKMVQSEGLETYLPENETRPRVYYKNLHLYEKCFISGSVALKDVNECADGARVILIKDSEPIEEIMANNYGDFKFDNLSENSGSFTLEVSFEGYKRQKLNVDLKTSVNIGTVFLV